jgi:hypothetical protein
MVKFKEKRHSSLYNYTRFCLGAPVVKPLLFHCAYATKVSSHFNSLFTICFGHTWPSTCVCRYAKLMYCTACHNSMWLVIFFYSYCSHLEHSASVKRFVSLQFLNLRQPLRLLGRGISPSQSRYLTETQHKHRHPCLEWDLNPRPLYTSGRRHFMP